MAIIDIPLGATYDSDDDDILEGFYVPVLRQASQYDRLAGYFSSSSLAASAKGMSEFVMNDGKMRLVTSVQITEQDQQAILDGLKKPDEVICRTIMDELSTVDQFQQNHVDALAWMVAKKRLEIKIAVPLRNNTYHTDKLDPSSIYHQKIGIAYDNSGNVISFSGSVNETAKSWRENIEEFKVFCSWKQGQDEFVSSDVKKFEKFWYGQARHTRVFDLPAAVKKHLIRNAPKTAEEAVQRIMTRPNRVNLRDYQRSAVRSWFEHNMHGILEMATGTGKTQTAISCIKTVLEKTTDGPILVVIACPYKHLVDQWIKELGKSDIRSRPAYGTSTSWRAKLKTRILQLNDGILDELVITTTHDTASMDKFINMVKSCTADSFLVVDEVHKIGTERRSECLLDVYKYRLGLSATPDRYLDDEGTQNITKYFGGVVYEFGLDRAIRSGHLTQYQLFPHIIFMTNEELDKYNKLNKSLAIEFTAKPVDHEKITQLLIHRSRVIKGAKNKLIEFRNILNSIGFDPKHCLVYCADTTQLDAAASILHERGIIFHRFTAEEKPEIRELLLGEFASGIKDVLLAIKCLDEGVDVPSTKTAIILASSHNPIEFIQRRGRILRPHANKEVAVIHDLIVLPRHLPKNSAPIISFEKTIIKNELERLKEFSRSSMNPEHSNKIIQELTVKYQL